MDTETVTEAATAFWADRAPSYIEVFAVVFGGGVAVVLAAAIVGAVLRKGDAKTWGAVAALIVFPPMPFLLLGKWAGLMIVVGAVVVWVAGFSALIYSAVIEPWRMTRKARQLPPPRNRAPAGAREREQARRDRVSPSLPD